MGERHPVPIPRSDVRVGPVEHRARLQVEHCG